MLTNIIIYTARKTYFNSGFGKFSGIFLVLTLFFLPPLCLSAYTYNRVNNQLNEMTLARRQAIALPLSESLTQELNNLADFGEYIALNPKFRSDVQSGDWNSALEVAKTYLAVSNNKPIDRIFLSDIEGNTMANTAVSASGTIVNFAYRDWYKGIMRTGKPYVSEVYSRYFEPKANVAAVAVPIIGDSQLMSGILVFQIKLDHFLSWAKDIKLGVNGYVYILDQYGHIVAHPNYPPQGEIIDFSSADVFKKIQSQKEGVDITFNNVENMWRLSAFDVSDRYGWSVVVQEPLESAYAQKDSALRGFLIFQTLMFLFYAVVAVGVIKAIGRLSKPV